MRNQFTLRKWNARAKHDVIKHLHPVFPGDYSVLEPPDPMPNSEVKRNSVDDSVGLPCESRTSPSTYLEKARFERVGLFCFHGAKSSCTVMRL